MIQNFENQTKPLTINESRIIKPVIGSFLYSREGKGLAVTSRQISEYLLQRGFKVQDVTIRKIIAHITTHNEMQWIISCSDGFYYSRNPEEVKSMITSLKDRESAIRYRRESLEKSLRSIPMQQGSFFGA